MTLRLEADLLSRAVCVVMLESRLMSAGRHVGRPASPSQPRAARGMRRVARYILYLPELVRVEALEPLLQPVAVGTLGREVHGLGVVDDRLLHQDRRPRAQRQRNRVARPGIDDDALAAHGEMDDRVEGVVLQVATRPRGRPGRRGR